MEKINLEGMLIEEKKKVLENHVGKFVEITLKYSFKKEEDVFGCYIKKISDKFNSCLIQILCSGKSYDPDIDRITSIKPIKVSQAEEKNLFKIIKIEDSIKKLERDFKEKEKKLYNELDAAHNKISQFRIGFNPTLIPEIIKEELKNVVKQGKIGLRISVRIESYKIQGFSVAIDDITGFYENPNGLAERNYEGYWELNSRSPKYQKLVEESEKLFDRIIKLNKENNKKFTYEKNNSISVNDDTFRLFNTGYLKMALIEPIDLTKANLKKFLKLALKDLSITGEVSEINYDGYYSI